MLEEMLFILVGVVCYTVGYVIGLMSGRAEAQRKFFEGARRAHKK